MENNIGIGFFCFVILVFINNGYYNNMRVMVFSCSIFFIVILRYLKKMFKKIEQYGIRYRQNIDDGSSEDD
jgi:predicted metal-dependent hydrolase